MRWQRRGLMVGLALLVPCRSAWPTSRARTPPGKSLVVAHGTAEEVRKAQGILAGTHAAEVTAHVQPA